MPPWKQSGVTDIEREAIVKRGSGQEFGERVSLAHDMSG